MTDLVYSILALTLISLVFPAWIVLRQAEPSMKTRGGRKPFQVWFLAGFFWFALSLAVHLFLSVGGIMGSYPEKLYLLETLYRKMLFAGWLVNCTAGTLLWIVGEKKGMLAWSMSLCMLYNAGVSAFSFLRPSSGSMALLGITAFPMAIMAVKSGIGFYRRRRDIVSLHCAAGCIAGCIGAAVWFTAGRGCEDIGLIGLHASVIGGGVSIAVGGIYHVTEKITGMRLYSGRTALIALAVFLFWGPWSALNMYGQTSSAGTVLGAGLGFAGLLVGTNLWMAFARMKDKTVDELSARWISLGAWLPSGTASRFAAFGGWLFAIGGFFLSISMFQSFALPLMGTIWKDGIITVVLIGGAGSMFIAAAYGAWSEKLSTPDDRTAEIGYWHYFGSMILMCACMLAGGLVRAAQEAVLPAHHAAGGFEAAVWQRPFQVGIAVADIMMFASILILTINLIRAGIVRQRY